MKTRQNYFSHHLLPLIAVLCYFTNAILADTCEHFDYVAMGKSIAISGYPTSASGVVEIPTIIDGKYVTTIKSRAFANCKNLTKILIPNTVRSIEQEAFDCCTSLSEISIPDGVKEIGCNMFRSCTSLVKITIPSSVTSIRCAAFQNCTSLRNVILPEGITSIEGSAFSNCTVLSSVKIPSSVTSIWPDAFLLCSGLTSVTIPEGVLDIGSEPFKACANLKEVTVDPHNAHYSSLDGVLYNKDQTALIQYPCGKSGVFTVPAGVTSIEDGALSNCTGLTNVTIPTSIIRIGFRAFRYCAELKTITVASNNTNYSSLDGVLYNKDQTALIQYPCGKSGIFTVPAGIISIGEAAFSMCDRVTSVTIPAGVASIGKEAFNSCESIETITVNTNNLNYSSLDGVLYNRDRTVLIQYPCGKSGSFTVPASVTSIEDRAFSYSAGLTNVIIPPAIIRIGYGAFHHCAELKAFTVDTNNTSYSSLDGVLYNKDQTALIQYPCGRGGNFMIPDGVTSIGDYAFYRSSKLDSVTISPRVARISLGAFFDCSRLTNAIFLGNAPQMGDDVFDYSASGFIVYYLKDKTGFTSPKWNGYSAKVMATPP